MQLTFLSTIPLRACIRGAPTIGRLHQDAFLARAGACVTGAVVEIGGERKRNNARFFPLASSYIVSNLTGDVDKHLDVTNLDLPENSQALFVCTSVLEHVANVQLALREMHRTLRPGGVLIATVPFLYPIHDRVDAWRIAPDGWQHLLEGWDVEELAHLGGRVATLTNLLQRGAGPRRLRTYAMKAAACAVALILGRRDELDDSPVAFGIVARKPR